ELEASIFISRLLPGHGDGQPPRVAAMHQPREHIDLPAHSLRSHGDLWTEHINGYEDRQNIGGGRGDPDPARRHRHMKAIASASLALNAPGLIGGLRGQPRLEGGSMGTWGRPGVAKQARPNKTITAINIVRLVFSGLTLWQSGLEQPRTKKIGFLGDHHGDSPPSAAFRPPSLR